MMNRTQTLGLAILLFAIIGCGKSKEKATAEASPAEHGRVAIVDLDKVALAVGEQAKVKGAVDKDQKDVVAVLDGLAQTARADLERMGREFGASPTAAQQKQLQARQTELEQALEVRRSQAENLLRVRQNARIESFRRQARPLVARLAKARGFSLVLTPTPEGGLLWSENAVDLTETLIEEINTLRQSGQPDTGPTTSPAASPKPSGNGP